MGPKASPAFYYFWEILEKKIKIKMEIRHDTSEYRYISLAEASELTPYSQEYLSLRVRQGKLKAIKDGRTWLTTKDWLDEYCSQPNVAKAWNHDAFSKIHEKEKDENVIAAEPEKEEGVLSVSAKNSLAEDIIEVAAIGFGIVLFGIKSRTDKIKKALINFSSPFLWNWQGKFIKAFLVISFISFLSALSTGGLVLADNKLRTQVGENIKTSLINLGQREVSFLIKATQTAESGTGNLLAWLGGTLTPYGQLSGAIDSGLVGIAEKFYPPTNILAVATEPIDTSSDSTLLSQAADLVALKAEIEKLKKTTVVVKEITNEISRDVKIENVQRVEQLVLPAGSYSTPNDVAALESKMLGVISRSQVSAQQAANYYTTNNFYSWSPAEKIDQLQGPTINRGAIFSGGAIRFNGVDSIAQTGSGQVSFSGNVDALAGLDVAGILTVSNTSTTTFGGAIASASGNFIVASGNAQNLLLNPYGGSVGIGTTSPSSALAVSGNGYFTGNLLASGTTGLTLNGAGSGITFSGTGNHDITASAGTLRIGSNTIIGNIQALDDTVDIGTAATRFDKVYANEVNATTLVGTLTGGNLTAETFSINSDNATADAENSYLSFERGSVSPNALLSWDSTQKRFDLNQSVFIQDDSNTSATSTLLVQSWSGQSTDIFRVASSSSETNSYLNVTGGGFVGIGTTSPWGLLSVNANGLVAGVPQFVVGSSTRTDLIITQSGNVGIGTTTPMSVLSVKSATANQLTLAYNDTKYATFTTDSNGLLTIAGNNGAGGNVLIDTGSNLGVGTDTPFALLSVDAPAGQASFIIGSSTTYMMVNNVGNVGIGTASPGANLDVYGSASSTLNVGVNSADKIAMAVDSSGSYISGGANPLRLTTDDGASYNILLMPGSGGKVGIGSSTPYLTLSVTGTAGGNNAWTNWSHSSMKENFADVSVLDKIAQLNIKEWQYKALISEDSSRHLSPFAEDFRGRFGLGNSDYMIQSLDVAGVALKGVQELYASSSPLFYGISVASGLATSSPFMSVDELGNLGIGTTTPATGSGIKLSVGGDIAATGFVNISTRDAKNNIEYFDSADYEQVLNEIANNVRVATYYYNDESACGTQNPPQPSPVSSTGQALKGGSNTPPSGGAGGDVGCSKRLGLIAEEAPKEILSANGKGIDLYKMASFTLMGVKALDGEVTSIKGQMTSLESRMVELEKKSGTVNDGISLAQLINYLSDEKIIFDNGTLGNFISGALAGILDGLKSLGVSVERGIVRAQNIFADVLQTRKITMNISPLESKDPTIGTAQINVGETDTYIMNNQISTTTKIFVTPEGAQPVSFIVCERHFQKELADNVERPQGFRLCVNATSSQIVKFNWWIVETTSDAGISNDQFPISNQTPNPNDQTLNSPSPSASPSASAGAGEQIIMSSSDSSAGSGLDSASSAEIQKLPVEEDLSTGTEILPSPSVAPQASPEPAASAAPAEINRLPLVEE